MIPIFIYADADSRKEYGSLTVTCRIFWPDQNQTTGDSKWKTNFAIYTFICLFAVPSIVIVICYFLIMSKIVQTSNRVLLGSQIPTIIDGRPTSMVEHRGSARFQITFSFPR